MALEITGKIKGKEDIAYAATLRNIGNVYQ